MATAVNEAGLGVTAKVVAGSGTETQQLVISSDNTGLAAAFSVSDISGNAIAATAVEIVATEAQDAQYTVDGTDYTSGSNTISLDDGMVTVNLKGVGESTLEIAPDANTVKNTISVLVSEINALVGFLESNSDYIKDEVLSSVNAYIDDHHSKLESFGITLGDDGKLGIDNTKLTEAIDQNPAGIKETFAGFDGLAVQFYNYASRITTDNPFNYAKEAADRDLYSMGQTYSLSAATSKNLLEGTLLNMIV
jgi:flagellar hook-associated protein 2